MDARCHFPEVIQFLPWLQHNVRILWIRRYQPNLPTIPRSLFPLPSYAQRLHSEVAVDACDDYVAVRRTEGPVDNEQVAVGDPRAGHRVALDAHEVGGGGPLDEKLVQVERRLEVLLGGRGDPATTEPETFTFELMA